MKKFKIGLAAIILVVSTTLIFNTNRAIAFDGSNYELTNCTINFPDGTVHIGAQCTYPLATGPCDKVAPCQGGAPPPIIQ